MFYVYSKPNCAFCDQAKALLSSHELPYQEIMLDVGQPKKDGQQYIQREELFELFPGARTVPQIALRADGQRQVVGGFTELRAMLSTSHA